MKIAVLAHLHFPICQPFAGGLEAHTYSLAQALMAAGHDVVVYCAEGSGPGFATRTYKQIDFSLAPSEEFVQMGEASYHRMCDDVARGNYDLIHNNSLHYIPMQRAHELGAPMVQVMHTPFFWELAAGSRVAKQHDSIRFISVSEDTAANWAPYIDNHVTIPNGIDLSQWVYNAQPKLDQVIYFGRLVPEKGVHLAIDAAKLAGKRILLAGAISNQSYFKHEIEPRLGEQAHYLGHLPLEELVVHVGQSECSIFSSLWPEPFGYILAESLACGTPIAGFRTGAVDEVVDETTSVLSDDKSAAALAECILQAVLLNRHRCQRYARQRFGIAAMVQAYEQVYEEEVAAFGLKKLNRLASSVATVVT